MHLLKQLNHEQLTMSSLEIAKLTGKRHDNVMLDIRKILKELDLSAPDFLGTYKTEQGNTYECFHLPKRETLILVSGYNVQMRALIIDRWDELEGKVNGSSIILPNFYSPVEAARAWANEVEAKELALKHLEIAAPKVDFYDALAERQNLMNATQLAQKFKKSAVAFNKILESFDVYNRCVKRGRVFQQWFIDQGLGELKETALGFAQPMFTTKGEQWVFNKFASEGII